MSQNNVDKLIQEKINPFKLWIQDIFLKKHSTKALKNMDDVQVSIYKTGFNDAVNISSDYIVTLELEVDRLYNMIANKNKETDILYDEISRVNGEDGLYEDLDEE